MFVYLLLAINFSKVVIVILRVCGVHVQGKRRLSFPCSMYL